MQLSQLLTFLQEQESYQTFLSNLQNNSSQPTLNIVRSARPYTLATLAQTWQGSVIYITAQVKRAYNVTEQLPVWLGQDAPIYRFAEPTAMFYDRLTWDKLTIRNRLETLSALLQAQNMPTEQQPIVVTSARALLQQTISPAQFQEFSIHLKTGQRFALDQLVKQWVEIGYEPATIVIEEGTFSRRGGILDIYPIGADYPIRIDFFDDEIDSIRHFTPNTQRTVDKVEHATIIPAREALPQNGIQVHERLSAWYESLQQTEKDLSGFAMDMDALANGQAFAHLEYYLPLMTQASGNLLDYATEDTLLIVEDWDEVRYSIQEITDEATRNRDEKLSLGQIYPDYPQPFVAQTVFEQNIGQRHNIEITNYPAEEQESATKWFIPGGRFGGQLRSVTNQIRKLKQQKDSIIVVTEQVKRLSDIWYEQDASEFIPTVTTLEHVLRAGSLILVKGTLQEGWSLTTGNTTLHLITDAEIFGWSRPEPRRRKQAKRGRSPEASYADWQNGDYVVHVDYGIGKFSGMRHRTIEGTQREYLIVEYDGTDTLFVPIHQADRLSKYVGAGDRPPKMNSLGKAIEWTRAKSKAKKDIEAEARELLEIYSQRAMTSGFVYTPDGAWQHELEASFPYVETEDQIQAIRQVKDDMESNLPMDRLICGDVGYGKTEVAVRAAFKAVLDGKQVAILVPTTILAQQHYETFQERLENFPVQVEMMSRFRTKDRQAEILPKIESGEVDILIGTHRILSEDIAFKDLGLLIIDEEQRFGVKHKEHFKKLRAEVDVLTLTATPIPRTLHMSISGVRDISMIQTPPEDRLPVITHVGQFDDRLIRQAILRELERGGQIFYIHNRVKSIDAIKSRLETIVPEAKIVVGHGQMTPKHLQNVMTSFSRGEYDVLLATTIIENGIDMPTVNTLIIDRADRFGMAQLYQLRGRVGRGAQQAYAYLFYQTDGKMTQEAFERLETLAEHTELGAGFQIAIRDLEIRGTGDILSTRQSGNVSALGLHLYSQYLKQAIRKQKEEIAPQDEVTPLSDVDRDKVVIDLPTPAYIPNDWIAEMALRLQLYRRIGNLQNKNEIEELRNELRDRFGQLPIAVDGLLYLMEVKLLAQAINATSIIKPRQHILIKLPYLVGVNRDALAYELGDDVEVSRTAVELFAETELWQLRLIEILEHIKQGFEQNTKIEIP